MHRETLTTGNTRTNAVSCKGEIEFRIGGTFDGGTVTLYRAPADADASDETNFEAFHTDTDALAAATTKKISPGACLMYAEVSGGSGSESIEVEWAEISSRANATATTIEPA